MEKEKLLNSSFIRNMLIYGSMIAAVTITAFYLGDPVHTVQTCLLYTSYPRSSCY